MIKPFTLEDGIKLSTRIDNWEFYVAIPNNQSLEAVPLVVIVGKGHHTGINKTISSDISLIMPYK
jgi:hypothetical protein